MAFEDDPYVDLEEAESDKAMEFALMANKMCLKALGDPTTSNSTQYSRILSSLESDERIPFVSKMGKDSNGDDMLYNLWKDTKVGGRWTHLCKFAWLPKKSNQSSLFTNHRTKKGCGARPQWHLMKAKIRNGLLF
jgi:prolyl oligopeptidase PreP (S9A serine peptidase family)